MGRDRSNEFLNITQAISTSTNKVHKVRQKQVNPQLQNAVKLVKSITEIEDRVGTIAKLVQKNSLFDDPTAQIEDLTVVIKHQIDSVRKEVEVINKPEAKAFSLFQKNKQAQIHWDSILHFLNSRLADATKQFSTSLISRTQKTKEQQKRVDEIINSPMSNTALRQRKRVFEVNPDDLPDNKPSTVFIPMPNAPQQVLFADNKKTGAVQKIEGTIAELQGIFSQLAGLVSEQGQLLDRIDTTMEGTLGNVNSAQNWLLKYQNAIAGNRAFMVKMFGMLIVIIFLFMYFYQ